MPWVDIIVILLIAAAAFIGFSIGLLGAFKGFISNIVGLVSAWLLAPLAQAWLEVKLGADTFLAGLISERLPASLKELIRGLAQTARTLQEVRENILSSPMPEEVALYLQRMLNKTPENTVPSPEMMVDAISREIAQSVMWAFLFLLIWLIASILIKGFLGMIFINKDGKTLLGAFDGILGLVALTSIVFMSLVVVSGLMYPLAVMSDSSEGIARVYPYLMDSRLIGWMAGIYQLYLVPWMG